MKRSLNLLALILSFSILISALFFLGCGKLDRKGTSTLNQPPVVHFANVPLDSTSFSIRPKIHWYGTDPDGHVVKYQYMVIRDTLGLIPKIGGEVDPSFVQKIENIHPDDWTLDKLSQILGIAPDSLNVVEVKSPGDNVMLYASLDTNVYVNQYLFVRGIDDRGTLSKIWKPESKLGHTFRRYSRNNHPPETGIVFDSTRIYFCLPEISNSWNGIRMTWEGSDDVDYPRGEPILDYSWELLGPYAHTENVNPDTGDHLVYQSWDSLAGDCWVDNISTIFVNLENYPDSAFGWYLFRVRARDDAFVVDATPATRFLRIVKPTFEKDILLIDATSYQGVVYGGFSRNPNELQAYYREVINATQNYKVDSIYFDPTFQSEPPDEILIGQYKLLVVTNGGWFSGLNPPTNPDPDGHYTLYKRYLDVGGGVWLIGLNNFEVKRKWAEKGLFLISEVQRDKPLTYFVAANYLGVSAVFLPGWDEPKPRQNQEFIGANPLPPANLPKLELDTLLFKEATKYDAWETRGDGWRNKIPHVNIEYGSYFTEPVYSFISTYGTSSKWHIDTEIKYMHGKPCGLRLDGALQGYDFKIAEFCFPLHFIKKEQSTQMMEQMLDWFLADFTVP